MAIYYWQAEIDVYRNYSASDNENRQIMRQGTVSSQTETYTVYPRFDDTETYTRTGYNFIGYGKTRDATVPTYQPHDSVPFTFTVRITASLPMFPSKLIVAIIHSS